MVTTYADTAARLKAAIQTDATHITVEVDEGTVTVSLQDALQHFEDLAPGEGFTVHLVHYSNVLIEAGEQL